MIGIVHTLMGVVPGWSQAATGSLVAAVWQGILLAAVAGLGLRLLPKTPAAVRFAVWFGVFAVVTALPVLSLWPHAGSVTGPGRQGAWITIDARWCVAIAAVWAVASLVRAGSLVGAALRVRALWKRATPVELEGVDILHPNDGDKAAMNGAPERGRRAQICTSDEVDRPTVIGFFSPKILIPSWLLEKLTAAELEQIVLHETGHLGRADDWMNLLQKIALVVFPLNPALAWVERKLCFERELAVDERVLQAVAGRAGAAKAYAACLATLAEYRLGRRALALALGALGRESHPSEQAGWGPRSELGRRVGRILRREAGMKPLHARMVLGGAMLGLLVAATGFERCPQVVGFAKAGSENLAGGQQWQPTHGDEAAMNGAPGGVSGGQVRAVSVVYKTSETRMIQPIANVTHETFAVAPARSVGQVRMVQTDAVTSAKARQASIHDEAAKDAPPSFRGGSLKVEDGSPKIQDGAARLVATQGQGVVQWVVVTEWHGGVGTRMVFTTARVTDATGQQDAKDPGTTASEPVGASEQGPRYAAVPVRGGWIVFQL